MRVGPASAAVATGLRADGTVKPNVLPDADLAVEPHPPAEQLDDPLGQREAQAGALLLRRSPAALLERLEDALAVLRRDADAGVGDGHRAPRRRPRRPHRRPATGGRELHRVRQQVEQHLLEAQLVGLDVADVGGDVEPRA